MTSATALSVSGLTRNEAQARNTLSQRAFRLPVRLGNGVWHARLIPTMAPLAFEEAGYTIQVEWSGAQFVLSLPESATEQLVSHLLEGASLNALSAPVIEAVVEAALGDSIRALQTLGRGMPKVLGLTRGIDRGGKTPPHALNLSLNQSNGSHTLVGTLFADGLGLLLAAGMVAKRQPVLGPLGNDVPLRLAAEIGYTRLQVAMVKSLSPGDVVLMDGCWVTPNRSLWLNSDGRFGVHVHWPAPDASQLRPYLTVIHPWTEIMPATQTEINANIELSTVENLPVRLSFDLGELTLTLAQLRALQPGQTLDLGHPLVGAVRIRANGALVGEGDLVEVDGQLGVSVRHLFANAD